MSVVLKSSLSSWPSGVFSSSGLRLLPYIYYTFSFSPPTFLSHQNMQQVEELRCRSFLFQHSHPLLYIKLFQPMARGPHTPQDSFGPTQICKLS